jgi:hypothetical protein
MNDVSRGFVIVLALLYGVILINEVSTRMMILDQLIESKCAYLTTIDHKALCNGLKNSVLGTRKIDSVTAASKRS